MNRKVYDALSETEQAELAPLIAAYEAHITSNPMLRFYPHPKQVEFLSSTKPLKAFLGGNRSGKTTCGILDDLIQAVDQESLAEHLKQFKHREPPFFCRVVAPDFTSTMEGVIFAKLREWCPKDQMEGGTWDKAYDKQRRMLWFKNGSWMQFLTFEQDLDKHSGAALHRVHFDEEPPGNIRRENLMRLIDFGGDELFTMTPLMGMSWMYDQIYEPWEKGELDDALVVTVDMDDNPHLDEVTKTRVLAGLTAEERGARKSGRFVHFAGMIYPTFNQLRHVIPSRPPSPDSFVYVGIDPGQRHLAAAVFVEVTTDDELVVFDEIGLQGEQATAAQMAREIGLRNGMWGITPRMYVIDPAARNKVHQTGRSDQMEYLDHGIPTVLGQNSVTAGINRVKERLDPIDMSGGHLEPKLLVTANCSGIIEEFKKYRWSRPSKVDNDAKEEPLKTNDHRLDALRYVCMARPLKPAVHLPPRNETIYQRLIREDMERTKRPITRGPRQFGPGMYA